MASAAKYAKPLPEFSNVLHEELNCFICDNGVIAGKLHWYKCLQGHMVCQDCKEVKDKKKCSCNKSFIPGGHCKMTEALLKVDKMRFKCENLTRGCQETMNEENMIFHQTECIYRLVNCPRGCKPEVPFHELFDHMNENKDLGGDGEVVIMQFKKEKEFEFEIKRSIWKKEPLSGLGFLPMMISIESKVFFSVLKSRGNLFYHWIHFAGSPNEAKNYSYTLEYQNEEQTVMNQFIGQVISIDETADSIIENGKCFGVAVKLFEAEFLNEKRLFKPLVTIRNLKQEAKDENVESGTSDNDE